MKCLHGFILFVLFSSMSLSVHGMMRNKQDTHQQMKDPKKLRTGFEILTQEQEEIYKSSGIDSLFSIGNDEEIRASRKRYLRSENMQY